MACCVFTALVMNRLIRLCEALDVKIIDIKYNEFDTGEDDEDASQLSKTSIVSSLALEGMTCASCVSAIETALNSLTGVHAIAISLPMSRASVIHDKLVIDTSELIAAIAKSGYTASAENRSAQQNLDVLEHRARLQNLRSSFGNAVMASGSIFSMKSVVRYLPYLHQWIWPRLLLIALSSVWIQVLVAKEIHRSAWKNIFSLRSSMDTLISLSLLLGFSMIILSLLELNLMSAQNYLSSGSLLAAVVLGGRYIRTLLERQISASLIELMKLQNKTRTVQLSSQSSGGLSRIPALALRPGHEIVLRTGCIVPCDCYIISGRCMVDESSMTGESLPKTGEPGDFLMSGTRVSHSDVVAVVSRSQEDSALEQLISSISTATEGEQTQDTTGILSTYFVPVILALATFQLIVSLLRAPVDIPILSKLYSAGEKAMAVLACACPCALGLATPTAVLSGISVAWSRGILFTSGLKAISVMAHLTHVAMDKTGTLTTGELTVSDVQGKMQHWHNMLVCVAEKPQAQVHPIAKAVFKWAISQLSKDQILYQGKILTVESESQLGNGIRSVLSMDGRDHEIHIGTEEFLCDHDVLMKDFASTISPGAIVVHIAMDKVHISSLCLKDTIRKESFDVVAFLRDRLSLDVTMLTGDSHTEANRISSALGIPVASSRVLPQAKKAFIQDLRSRDPTNKTAMVGDGINDAPAMSKADVGILISPGFSRSNQACVQAADMILTSASLGGLVEAILIAQMTEKQIKFNRSWAILYNVIAVTVAMGGMERWGVSIDASMAGMMMAGSSISVIIFSLTLRHRLQAISFDFRDEAICSSEKSLV